MGTSVLLVGAIVVEIILFIAAAAIFCDFLVMLCMREMRAPFVPTPRSQFDAIFDALKLEPGAVLYDLGCGDGSFILTCAAREPRLTCVGIERNPLLYLYARMRSFRDGSANVRFVWGNFFNADLSEATHMYTYLVPSVMDILLDKLARETRGTRLVSRAFEFQRRRPIDTIALSQGHGLPGGDRLFVYEF